MKCIYRDQLVNITTTTGFRLNGEGFIILDGRSYAMKKRSDVTLKFKTYAKDGLLFLALRDLVFLSVELTDGHVRYQVKKQTLYIIIAFLQIHIVSNFL